MGGFLDSAKTVSGAATDEFSWFLNGDVVRAERDYWLLQAQKQAPELIVSEKERLAAIMFAIGILAPSPDDAVKMVSKKASKKMYDTLGEAGAKKFYQSMTKYARTQNDNGIKRLKGDGIDGYMYEVKIKGAGSAYRLLGNIDSNGDIIWSKFKKTH